MIIVNKNEFEKIINECKNVNIEKIYFAIGIIEKEIIKIIEIIECKNIAENPIIEFKVDPLCLYKLFKYAEEKRLEIVALIHSHPILPYPSDIDIKNMKLWRISWITINYKNGNTKAWVLKNDKIKEIHILKI
mgnify:CR=1 FL=1